MLDDSPFGIRQTDRRLHKGRSPPPLRVLLSLPRPGQEYPRSKPQTGHTGRSLQGPRRLFRHRPRSTRRERIGLPPPQQRQRRTHASPKTGKTLTPEQKKIIETWIASGAKYEEHWSFRPIAKPALPPKRSSDHPIDRFLENSLSKEKLALSPEADRITLLRRLYFDLIGMSPNPKEADLFLNDSSPEAFEQLVDRLLADERFGERMAVHWLDLVRFADTIGYHSDNFMEVSAYRDYVIEAFNDNLPYDQFVIENIAGDLLPEASNRQKVASGYNRLLQTTQEGGAQPDEYVTIYQADRVGNFGNVWLAATTGCAQCHDHKYDPFTIKDFYSLAAFFADIKEKAVGRRTPNLTLPTPEEEARLKELEEKLAQAEKVQKERKTDTDRQKRNFSPSFTIWSTRWSTQNPKPIPPLIRNGFLLRTPLHPTRL